jgi:hypothetical protein
MKLEDLKRAKDRRPFQPFHVRMADGREIEVRHPDAVAWEDQHSRAVTCIVAGGGWEVFDIMLVTSLAGIAPPAARPEGNGD